MDGGVARQKEKNEIPVGKAINRVYVPSHVANTSK